MPKYEFSELKQGEAEEVSRIPVPDNYQRTLYLPVNKEIIDALTIDDRATVTLVGKVVGLEAREGSEYSSHEVQLTLSSIEIYPDNEFSELADDDDGSYEE